VTIKDDPDQKYFIHHPTLRRLGLYLMDTFRFNKEGRKKSYPLVLAALNPVSSTYIVAGLWSTLYRSEGSVVKNEFGQFFMRAGANAQARIRMASFDTSVMEIKSDDMAKFFSSLSTLTRTGM
jgi:cell division control protein 45